MGETIGSIVIGHRPSAYGSYSQQFYNFKTTSRPGSLIGFVDLDNVCIWTELSDGLEENG